jgi:hypothetical protein
MGVKIVRILNLLSYAAIAALIELVSPTANAATFQFLVDYTNPALNDFSFTLESSPSNVTVFDGGDAFYVTDRPNTSANSPFGVLAFFNSTLSGGFGAAPNLIDDYYFSFVSSQLFSGSTSSPTFLTDTYALFDYASNEEVGSLVISDVSAVPEPSTWAMLLIGFVGIGFMTVRRRRVASLAFPQSLCGR